MHSTNLCQNRAPLDDSLGIAILALDTNYTMSKNSLLLKKSRIHFFKIRE